MINRRGLFSLFAVAPFGVAVPFNLKAESLPIAEVFSSVPDCLEHTYQFVPHPSKLGYDTFACSKCGVYFDTGEAAR